MSLSDFRYQKEIKSSQSDISPIDGLPYLKMEAEHINDLLQPFITNKDFSDERIEELFTKTEMDHGLDGIQVILNNLLLESELSDIVKSDIFFLSHRFFAKDSINLPSLVSVYAMYLANRSGDEKFKKIMIKKNKELISYSKETLQSMLERLTSNDEQFTEIRLREIINQLTTPSSKPTLQRVPVQVALMLEQN